MSAHSTSPAFPRGPLVAAGALVLATLVTVAVVRLTGVGAVHFPDASAVQSRELRFADRSDGAVEVIDARSGRTIEVVTGANGFLRGTLRGLARERKRAGAGQEVPFTLTARADGRLTLEDPATQRRVDLESFGPDNAVVFARMLAAP